jgi:tRNA(adenine34) deaminase
MHDDRHIKFMKLALAEAKKAFLINEVPVGAVLVAENGEILSMSHNRTISQGDPTAHAEILALREGAKKIKNYRLSNTVLYVTIEPCIMCMGAIIHARLDAVVFGARDPKWGAAGSLYSFADDKRLNHRLEIIAGVYESQCVGLMQRFFRAKR